jgi:hypothetical protein
MVDGHWSILMTAASMNGFRISSFDGCMLVDVLKLPSLVSHNTTAAVFVH